MIINSYDVQCDEHPVLAHLCRALDNSSINFTCEELNHLELELECFTMIVDKELESQIDSDMIQTHFELIRWISPHDVLIGTIGGY